MLKVECEACKAPYQVDERRVPAAGLKMRCPKCGHSFMVTTTGTASPPAVKRSVAPPPRVEMPSDFPSALRAGDFDVPATDLPDVAPARRPPQIASPPAVGTSSPPLFAADLPAPRVAKPTMPSVLPPRVNADLPASRVAADLPARSRKVQDLSDLPVVLGHDAPLPVVAGSDLPAIAHAGLPSVSHNAPLRGSAFGDIELPVVQENLPSSKASSRRSVPPRSDPFGDFGELDLPAEDGGAPLRGFETESREQAERGDRAKRPSLLPPDFLAGVTPAPPLASGDSMPPPPPSERPVAGASRAGGMGFGEVELTGGDGTGASRLSLEAQIPERTGAGGGSTVPDLFAPPPLSIPPGEANFEAAAPAIEASIPSASRQRSTSLSPPKPKPKRTKRVAFLAFLTLALAGGASLQLTRHGAFGYMFISDLIRANDYQRAEAGALAKVGSSLEPDTYDQTRASVDGLMSTQSQMPRAESLAALAAFEEFLMVVRFGPDPKANTRGAVLLKTLPSDRPIRYRTAAIAADAAAHGDLEKARKTLEPALREHAGGDKIFVRELDILSAEIALSAREYKEALASFGKAQAAKADARAAFGVARAKWGTGDREGAIAAIEQTLKLSPKHVGARVLRATIAENREGEETLGNEQLTPVLDGPLRPIAAPLELAEAYATRGWLAVNRGALVEARPALEEALKLNPRSVRALRAQGELFIREGRYTEALTRFETALQAGAFAPETAADVARALLKLERLQDAKKRLSEGVEKFPNHPTLLALMGQVEQHLGNLPAAEMRFRAAIAAVDASRRDAIFPFVALSGYLSARGQPKEAESVLQEARTKLPDSAALQKAFGEVAEAQSDLDRALTHYRGALTRESTDLATRFRVAVVLRRLRRFDEAAKEFEKIDHADKDFPGLAVERGLLFEASGQVERAIESFKTALEKAPTDLDLQLRVGSAYVTIGRPTEALGMLGKVLDQRPQSAEVNHFVGRAHMLRGREGETEALRFLKRAVDLDPNRAEYHLYLGWEANDATPPQLTVAREEIDKALALDQRLCEGYWQRGVFERKAGTVNDALKNLKHALELCPARFEIYGSLAELYEDRNEVPAALAAWSTAMRSRDVKPFWHYRYGRLLTEHGNAAEAGPHFEAASKRLESVTPKPAWFVPLEFHLGETLARAGRKQEALAHYRKYLELAPASDPDRKAAQKYVDDAGR